MGYAARSSDLKAGAEEMTLAASPDWGNAMEAENNAREKAAAIGETIRTDLMQN